MVKMLMISRNGKTASLYYAFYVFFLVCCFQLLAQEETVVDEVSPPERNFVWVWDYQDPDPEIYPVTRHYFWEFPSYVIQANFAYRYNHSQNDDTSNNFFYNTIFRPIVFPFADANTISIGVSAFSVYDYLDGEELDEGVDGDFDNKLYNYSIGPSILFSFPSLGIQFTLEMTYYWQKLVFTTDEFPLDLGGGIIIDVPVRNTQKERGFGGFFLFNYFCDRTFLYGFEWPTTWSFPHSKRRVDTTVAGVDIAQTELETFFIDSTIFIRAFAIPVNDVFRISFFRTNARYRYSGYSSE